MSEPLIVTVAHLRAAKMCSRGARVWFEKRGWDWQAFLKNGLPAEQFEATGDAMAIQLVEVARGRK